MADYLAKQSWLSGLRGRVAAIATAILLLQALLVLVWTILGTDLVREVIARSFLTLLDHQGMLERCDEAPEAWLPDREEVFLYVLRSDGRPYSSAAPVTQVDTEAMVPGEWSSFAAGVNASVLTLDRPGVCRSFVVTRPSLSSAMGINVPQLTAARLGINMLVVVLFVVVLAVPLVRRIRRMVRDGAAVVSADFRGDVPEGKDELGELGRQFNEACRVARHRLDELTRRDEVLISTLADLAHDIRTPLASLKLGLSSGAPQSEADLEPLRAEVEYLDGLFSNLASMAQIESNELRLHPTNLDVRETVRHVALRFQTVAADAGVTVEAALPADAARVVADPIALEQALGNLVHNAIKFASREVIISVVAEGEHVALEIIDDGPGIQETLIDGLLGRWRRGERMSSHRDGQRGLGLGLAIVQAITKAHGGELILERAEESGGTRATVRIPAG